MSTHLEPYVYLYITGCLCTLIVLIAKTIILSFIYWITKENILNKNLENIKPPKKKPTFLKYFVSWIFDISLSWISVIINLYALIVPLFRVLRNVFTSVPEEIKLLRFPLKNNPDMTRESAWAHLAALGVKSGVHVPNESILIQELNEIHGYYQSFDRTSALKQLDNLHIISSEIISNALKQLQSGAFHKTPIQGLAVDQLKTNKDLGSNLIY